MPTALTEGAIRIILSSKLFKVIDEEIDCGLGQTCTLEEAIPFTELVNEVVDKERVLLLTIDVFDDIPFTLEVIVFVALLIELLFIIAALDELPLTLLVIVLVALDKLFVIGISAAAAAETADPSPFKIPLTVVCIVSVGVVVGFKTDPLNPLALFIEKLVTVPPDPVDTRVVPTKDSPDPKLISEGAADDPVGLPNNLVAVTSWILA